MSNSGLDVLIINPGDRHSVYQSLGNKISAIEPPVWAGMLARFVRVRGCSVQIIDANAEGLNPDETAQRTKDIDPVLAVLVVYGHQPSASTQNMPAAGRISAAIKDLAPEIPVLMLGGHVSALPERTLNEERCDYTCKGEGLHTVVSLVAALKGDLPKDLEKVPGLWYRIDGQVVSNEQAPLIKDLDADLPGLAWELLPMKLYRAHNWHCFGQPSRQPYAAIYTGLGCPYKCTFCCINAPFGGSGYRCRSPENVMAEIDLLVNEYGVRNIKFADELFVLQSSHVAGICDLIVERGYDLNIWAYARVDTVNNTRLLGKLRQAGIKWLALGIESGNERVLDDAHKKTGGKLIIESVKRIRAAGIHIIGNYIFGLPEDDMESMRQTLDLAKDLNCEFANFYSAMAYPGSALYDMALENNWALPKHWSGYSQYAHDTLPLPTKYLASNEVLRFRDKAFIEYYRNSAYQQMLQKTFGNEAVDAIRELLSHKLERKYN